jgi:hypothetical protein
MRSVQRHRALIEIARLRADEGPDIDRALALKVGAFVDTLLAERTPERGRRSRFATCCKSLIFDWGRMRKMGQGWVVPIALSAPFAPAARWSGAAAITILVMVSAWRLARRASARRFARVIARRAPAASGNEPFVGPPYRGVRALRRITRRLAPPLSGPMVALVVGGVLVATAALIPLSLHLRPWVEIEAVLFSWWTTLAIALSVLLYKGWRIAVDSAMTPAAPPDARPRNWGEDKFVRPGMLEWGEGCLDIDGLKILAGFTFLLLLGGLVVEFIAPAVLFGCYSLLIGALRRIANDGHACEERPARAAIWGAIWAGVYTLPFALLAWVVHRLRG